MLPKAYVWMIVGAIVGFVAVAIIPLFGYALSGWQGALITFLTATISGMIGRQKARRRAHSGFPQMPAGA